MAIPTKQFSKLSLPDDMRFAASSLSQRKKRIRGILASFDRDEIPSTYRTDIFSSIDEEQARRPSSEWIIGDDLEGSLMQRGCHDAATWVVLNELEPADVRMRKFGQKIHRLFRAALQKYDQEVPLERDKTDRRALVEEISQTMRTLSRAARSDLEEVSEGLNNLAQALLSALGAVCERNMDSVRRHGTTRTRRSSGGELEISLYHHLIHGARSNDPVFILPALEAIKMLAPATFRTTGMRNSLRQISGTLLANGAPKTYRDRLDSI